MIKKIHQLLRTLFQRLQAWSFEFQRGGKLAVNVAVLDQYNLSSLSSNQVKAIITFIFT